MAKDCDLLCDPDSVRRIDEQKGREFATLVGKVVGENIKVRFMQKIYVMPSHASSTFQDIPEKLRKKAVSPTPVAGPSKAKAEEKPKVVKKEDTKPAAKKGGVNDFFKPRETVKKEPVVKEAKPTVKKGVAAGFFKKVDKLSNREASTSMPLDHR